MWLVCNRQACKLQACQNSAVPNSEVQCNNLCQPMPLPLPIHSTNAASSSLASFCLYPAAAAGIKACPLSAQILEPCLTLQLCSTDGFQIDEGGSDLQGRRAGGPQG